jgi:hypothetical protein
LSPYLWIPGLNFTATSLRNTRGTNIAWWDTVSPLFSNTIGAMGRIEAWKGLRAKQVLNYGHFYHKYLAVETDCRSCPLNSSSTAIKK